MTRVVRIAAVAAIAGSEAGMIERGFAPAKGIVAAAALVGVMVGWGLSVVTGGATIAAAVVKVHLLPVAGLVAGGALLQIVIWLLRSVAFLANGNAGVIERGLLPVLSRVAIGALAGVMILRPIFGQVAGGAVIKAGVVKGNVTPISRVEVAVNTSAGRVGQPGAALQPYVGR